MIFVLAVTLAMGYYKEMVIFGVGLTLLNLILIAKHDLDIFGVTLKISMDTVSLSLVNLTLIISMLMILSSMNLVLFKKFERYFLMVVITLTLILTFTFMVINIFWFYILFEASLVPTFILILGWGYQPERAQAGVYMLLYTIFASLPLLVSILVWKNSLGTLSFILTPPMKLYFLSEKMWILVSMLAFVVKLPLYMTHLWLPKAHVEAPVAGSMILAAILLKLGGYGLMRLSCVTQYLVFAFGPYIMGFTLVGGIYVGLTCIFQTDIKVLIALSSVAHMALVMAGIMSLSSAGMNSSFLIMVSHGFSSSALFSIANMTYERIGSRSLFYSKGVGLVLPSLLFCWFMLCLTNMSAPPSLNLFSEMISAIAIISWSFLSFAPLIMLIFMSAAYSLFLYSSSQHGKFQIATKIFNSSSLREHLILFMHWLPLNVLILAPSFLAPYL